MLVFKFHIILIYTTEPDSMMKNHKKFSENIMFTDDYRDTPPALLILFDRKY